MYSYTLRVRKTQSLKMSHCGCARQCLSQQRELSQRMRAAGQADSDVKLLRISNNQTSCTAACAAQHGLEAMTVVGHISIYIRDAYLFCSFCSKDARLPAAAAF